MLQKVGCGSHYDEQLSRRRNEIRTWSRADVRRVLQEEAATARCRVLVPSDKLPRSDRSDARLTRLPLVDLLYEHNVDGNALLELTETDLLHAIGVVEVGMVKLLTRTIHNLVSAPPGDWIAGDARKSSQSNAIRYSALDPFDGWDAPRSTKLHPNRRHLIHVSVDSAQARPSKRNGWVGVVDNGAEADRPSAVEVADNASKAESGTQSARDLEEVVEEHKAFRLGPLERERRNSEAGAAFDVLCRTSNALSLAWFGEAAGRYLNAEGEDFIKACYAILSTSRASHGERRRPWSALVRNEREKPLTEYSVTSSRTTLLSKSDFRALVLTLFESREPSSFDGFMKFLSRTFGEEMIESTRREGVVSRLYASFLSGRGSVDQSAVLELLRPMRGPVQLLRPASAPISRRAEATTPVTLQSFCKIVLEALSQCKADEFDLRILSMKAMLGESTHGHGLVRERQLLSAVDLGSACMAAPRGVPVVLLLSDQVNPIGVVELLFTNCKTEPAPGKPWFPSVRQRLMHTVSCDSDASLTNAVETVSVAIERGFWVFADCTDKSRLAVSLRKLAMLVVTRPFSEVHHAFRLFVRCPVDVVDPYVIPQIVRTVSTLVPMFKS